MTGTVAPPDDAGIAPEDIGGPPESIGDATEGTIPGDSTIPEDIDGAPGDGLPGGDVPGNTPADDLPGGNPGDDLPPGNTPNGTEEVQDIGDQQLNDSTTSPDDRQLL